MDIVDEAEVEAEAEAALVTASVTVAIKLAQLVTPIFAITIGDLELTLENAPSLALITIVPAQISQTHSGVGYGGRRRQRQTLVPPLSG